MQTNWTYDNVSKIILQYRKRIFTKTDNYI
jgi:hypothetical protein